jgi:hypothetical protein
MPFNQLGPEPLDAVIHLRVTLEEREEIEAAAKAAAMSRSQYIRRRIFGRKVIAKTDAQMVAELRRLGGLLKLIHNESEGAYSQQTGAMLRELGAAIERVGAAEEAE